jgi:hypothetical protein
MVRTEAQKAIQKAIVALEREINDLSGQHLRSNSREDSRIILGKIHQKLAALKAITATLIYQKKEKKV